MSYFFFLPAYWLCGILLYGASSRHSFKEIKKTTRAFSLIYTIVLIFITVGILLISNASTFTAFISPLILLMFFIPAPVFLLSHKPNWAWPSLIFVSLFSGLFQLLEATHVA